MGREITVAADLYGGVGVGEPAEVSRRANRAVRGGSLDALALVEEVLAGFPDGFEGTDEPQDRAVALDQRVRCSGDGFTEGRERRLRFGEPFF